VLVIFIQEIVVAPAGYPVAGDVVSGARWSHDREGGGHGDDKDVPTLPMHRSSVYSLGGAFSTPMPHVKRIRGGGHHLSFVACKFSN
jgi:hypothetical protein